MKLLSKSMNNRSKTNILAVLLILCSLVAVAAPDATNNQRKALVLGRGLPLKEANGGSTHPQGAKDTFLKLVGNPGNKTKKGWTCDLSYDLMLRLGMNPRTTSYETLFRYIGAHHLGYRIVINNSVAGESMPFWDVAIDNGMMPFAPHFNNAHARVEDPMGIKAASGVGGGSKVNVYSYGPSLEFHDALPMWLTRQNFEDAAESWANQAVAAKFAKILDAHPRYNIWDARQHLRQAGSHYAPGWTEEEGFGRVDEKAAVTTLLPGSPVEFWSPKSHSNRQVLFSWRNFQQSDFAATVIARNDGRIIYEGTGTNYVWTSDLDGEETFKYWSKNKAGVTSRLESFNSRTVKGLYHLTNQTCLILGAPAADDTLNRQMYDHFARALPAWVCDIVYQPGNKAYDSITNFPADRTVAVLADYPAMVSYAIEKKYRMIVVAASQVDKSDLYAFKKDWDRAVASGVAVILPHHYAGVPQQFATAHRERPPRLFSAMVTGAGFEANMGTYGPGLEFFDHPSSSNVWSAATLPNGAAALLSVKLAKVMDANPGYNIWDARQHLRQSANHYASGWNEKGGYGQPPLEPEKITELDIAPPLEIQTLKSEDGRSITFSWENFPQSSFAETLIQKQDGTILYHGTGTNFVWKSDVTGEETFYFHSKSKSGRLSNSEAYTVITVKDLVS
jgi:hypothetical protein